MFEIAANSMRKSMSQAIQLACRWRLGLLETQPTVGLSGIDTVKKQHVVMNTEVERAAEALDQGDCSGPNLDMAG